MSAEYKKSFDEWYAMPPQERRHRKTLFLADREQEMEALDEAQRAAWMRSLAPVNERDFLM